MTYDHFLQNNSGKYSPTKVKIIFIFFLITIFSLSIIVAGENGTSLKSNFTSLKVYYDGGGELFNYIRTEIDFVQFVRDPLDAHVHLQINSQPTGDGGKMYSLYFTGQRKFKGINDTLLTSVPANGAKTEIYLELVRVVKLGLVAYLNKTPLNQYVDVVFNGKKIKKPKKDNWDSWVFSIGLNGSVESEESKQEILWEADLDVDRITEESKIRINGTFANEVKKYEEDEKNSTSYKRDRRLKLVYVNSVSQNFSVGIFSEIKSRTYQNIKTGFNIAPAIEYNLFPYSESIRKNFTFLYRIGYTYNNYYEPTIFFRKEENLFNQAVKIDYTLKEIWGEVDMYLEASNYLHDFSKNRIEFRSRVSFRVSGSFFFNVLLRASYVNDQLYLPNEDATLEEILLNQIKLSTQYEYELKFGVRYTFGSIYNSVVNTRF